MKAEKPNLLSFGPDDHVLSSSDGFYFDCSCGLKRIAHQQTAQQHVIQGLHGTIEGLRHRLNGEEAATEMLMEAMGIEDV